MYLKRSVIVFFSLFTLIGAIATVLPGPGVLWLSQTIRWAQVAYVRDEIVIRVEITHVADALRTLVLDTTIHNDREELLLSGEAKMMMLGPQASVEIGDYCALVGATIATNGRVVVGD